MKKISAILLCFVAIISLFAGCESIGKQTPAYIGSFYSKEAKAMGATSVLTISQDGTFKMESTFEGKSALIVGKYEEISKKEILITPEKQTTKIDGKEETIDMKDQPSATVTVDGDSLTVGGEGGTESVTYIREGSDEE